MFYKTLITTLLATPVVAVYIGFGVLWFYVKCSMTPRPPTTRLYVEAVFWPAAVVFEALLIVGAAMIFLVKRRY